MEDILIVIFQLLFEVIIQVLAELPWELYSVSPQPTSYQRSHAGTWICLSLAAGASIGGISLLILPTTLLQWAPARIANLIVAPSASALVSLGFSGVFQSRTENRPNAKLRAVCAACFTFSLAIIRFTYASRPGR